MNHYQQCIRIKFLLERLSGVQDIGIRSRKRFNSDLKKTYYKLCREHTKTKLNLIGSALGSYKHANVIHSIKAFDNLNGTATFTCTDIYKNAKLILNAEEEARSEFVSFNEDFPKHFITSIAIREKCHSVIRRKAARIKELEKENSRLIGLIEIKL